MEYGSIKMDTILKALLLVCLCFGIQLSCVRCELQVASVNSSDLNNSRQPKNQRIQNLWTDECITNTNKHGTCMTRFNCLRNGGSISGYCSTYGICCETNLACGGDSSMKRTIIQSQNLPSGICAYHFKAISSSVCQMRIDFIEMTLSQPTIENDEVKCTSDYLKIGDLILCGINTNQHIYVDFDASSGRNDMTIEFKQTSNMASWNLIVTQLECPKSAIKSRQSSGLLSFSSHNSIHDLRNIFSPKSTDESMLAPAGCLQYFTKRSDTIHSFNFNNGNGPYMSQLNYGICFKRERDDKSIAFHATQFQLPIAFNAAYGGIDNDCRNYIEMDGSPKDYLMIPDSVVLDTPKLYGTLYCGDVLANKQIISTLPGLFMLNFVSDDMYVADKEVGFSLTYTIS